MNIPGIAIQATILVTAVMAVGVARKRRSLQRQVEDFAGSGGLDPTGLLNRNVFEVYALGELNRARRFQRKVIVAVCAIRWGEPNAFGSTLCQVLEFPVMGFRLRDNVFAIVAPVPPRISAERLRYDIELMVYSVAESGAVDVGIANFPDDGRMLHELIECAGSRLDCVDRDVADLERVA